jgi:hypothetical protein
MDLGLLAQVECRIILEIKVAAVVEVVPVHTAGMEAVAEIVARMEAVADIGAVEQVDFLLDIQMCMADPGVPA